MISLYLGAQGLCTGSFFCWKRSPRCLPCAVQPSLFIHPSGDIDRHNPCALGIYILIKGEISSTTKLRDSSSASTSDRCCEGNVMVSGNPHCR